jgi:hypothetical protein
MSGQPLLGMAGGIRTTRSPGTKHLKASIGHRRHGRCMTQTIRLYAPRNRTRRIRRDDLRQRHLSGCGRCPNTEDSDRNNKEDSQRQG